MHGVQLSEVHEGGGVAALSNAAGPALAGAAGVPAECVHVMSVRGDYDQGIAALAMLQGRHESGSMVVVDVELLCPDSAAHVAKIQAALDDDSSALRTGYLAQYLSDASFEEGGVPDRAAVAA